MFTEYECLELLLNRVAIGARDRHDLCVRDLAMLYGEFENS